MADDEVIECAYRAMRGLELKGLPPLPEFKESVSSVDLFGDERLPTGNVLLAALAVHSYADDLQDYLSTDGDDDFYLAAETAVEVDAEGSPWRFLFDSHKIRLDTVAAIVELMLRERGAANSALVFEAMRGPDGGEQYRRSVPAHPDIAGAKMALLGSRPQDR